MPDIMELADIEGCLGAVSRDVHHCRWGSEHETLSRMGYRRAVTLAVVHCFPVSIYRKGKRIAIAHQGVIIFGLTRNNRRNR